MQAKDDDAFLGMVTSKVEVSAVTSTKVDPWIGLQHYIQDTHASGVHPNPEKVEAIKSMPEPTSVADVRQFMGMVNQLSKFILYLADRAKPLRDLLSKKNQ